MRMAGVDESKSGELVFVEELTPESVPWHNRSVHFRFSEVENFIVDLPKVAEEIVHRCLIAKAASIFVKVRSVTVWAHRRRTGAEASIKTSFFQLNAENDRAHQFVSGETRVKFIPDEEQMEKCLTDWDSHMRIVEVEKPKHIDVTVIVEVLWRAGLDNNPDWLPWSQRPERSLCDVDLCRHIYKLRCRYGKCTDLEFAEALGTHSKRLWDLAMNLDCLRAGFLPTNFSAITGDVAHTRGKLAEHYRKQYEGHRNAFHPVSVQKQSKNSEFVVKDPDEEIRTTRTAKLWEIRYHYKELYEAGVISKEARDFYCDYPLSDEAIDSISNQWWSDRFKDLDNEGQSGVEEEKPPELRFSYVSDRYSDRGRVRYGDASGDWPRVQTSGWRSDLSVTLDILEREDDFDSSSVSSDSPDFETPELKADLEKVSSKNETQKESAFAPEPEGQSNQAARAQDLTSEESSPETEDLELSSCLYDLGEVKDYEPSQDEDGSDPG